MTKSARNIISIVATLVVSAIGLKLYWDDYQMDRAMEQNPKVVALIDQIRPFPDSQRIDSEYEGPSSNEYSSVVWRYYLSDANCSDVQEHLGAEASRNGFKLSSIGNQNNGKQVYHRKGEYELRSQFKPQNHNSCDYAISVNWYGLNR